MYRGEADVKKSTSILKERIVSLVVSPRVEKKYRARIRSAKKPFLLRNIDFGARDYEQYKDSTGIGAFSSMNHGSLERRRRYFLRHSGVENKSEALRREYRKSGGRYNAKILSHRFLW